MEQIRKTPSPCLGCTRVKDPRSCENKNCVPWRNWFLQRWEWIHNYPRVHMESADLKPVGVNIGGKVYAPPHEIKNYANQNPCEKCVCPKDLCAEPCKVRRAWDEFRKETFI